MMEAGVEPGNSLVDRSARRATFRITALGFGGSATTRVVLQSTYRP
jgi:type IV pilus assembly protein PilX